MTKLTKWCANSLDAESCFLIFLFSANGGGRHDWLWRNIQTIFTVVIREEGSDVAPSRIDWLRVTREKGSALPSKFNEVSDQIGETISIWLLFPSFFHPHEIAFLAGFSKACFGSFKSFLNDAKMNEYVIDWVSYFRIKKKKKMQMSFYEANFVWESLNY